MHRTRLSLYYLASYLTFGGLGFLAAPQEMLSLFFCNGSYSDVMVRFVGALLLALGIVVIQVIRYHLSQLYFTTLLVRSIILSTMLALYFSSRDPLMITLSVIVGLGLALTLSGYIVDRARSGRA